MPNVTARYWGIGRNRVEDGSTLIGEVEFYEATPGDATEMTQLVASVPMYSDWLSNTGLAPSLLESMNGDLSSQQTITANAGRRFGIALDTFGPTAVRVILIRNASDKDAESFIPFAIDDPDYFLTHDLAPVKIRQYSILKTIEDDGTINYIYTILPVVETDNPSIARGSLTKPKIGVC